MLRNMSREEFGRWYELRVRLLLFLETSEALLMFITLLWGFYLIVMANWRVPDPVSLSLLQTWPSVPLWVHGLGLMGVSLVHAYGIVCVD